MPGYLARNLILLPGIFPDTPVLTVAWVLPLIMCGYVLLPVGIWGLRRIIPTPMERFTFWMIAAGLWVGAAIVFDAGPIRFCFLFVGCAVHKIVQAGSLPGRRRALIPVLISAGAISLVAILRLQEEGSFAAWSHAGRTAFSLLATAVLLISVSVLAMLWERESAVRLSSVPLNSLLQRFGALGYSIYLWHGPVIKTTLRVSSHFLTGPLASPWLYWATLPVCLWLTLALSRLTVSHIDEPAARWLRDRMRQAPAGNAAAGQTAAA